jgi:hypothetical protein
MLFAYRARRQRQLADGWPRPGLLSGVHPLDLAWFPAAVALLACLPPARRAARPDPAEGLRGEQESGSTRSAPTSTSCERWNAATEQEAREST